MRKTLVAVIVLLVISNVVTGLLLYEHSEDLKDLEDRIDNAQAEIAGVEAEAELAIGFVERGLVAMRAELDAIPTTVNARDILNPFLCSHGDVAVWDFSGLTCYDLP
jgi:hypothetical protein